MAVAMHAAKLVGSGIVGCVWSQAAPAVKARMALRMAWRTEVGQAAGRRRMLRAI
jgi:hypothetical protein